jgi:hypothetical protein
VRDGQHSHRYIDIIQKACNGKWKVEIGHSETWCENGSKVKRQKHTGAQRPLIPLRCALSIFSVEEDS